MGEESSLATGEHREIEQGATDDDAVASDERDPGPDEQAPAPDEQSTDERAENGEHPGETVEQPVSSDGETITWGDREGPSVHERAEQPRHELPDTISVGEYHAYFHADRWSGGDAPLVREGEDVDWLASDEWLAYDVDIRESGPYDLTATVAADDTFGGGSFVLVVDEQQVGQVSFEPTGGWYQWQTVEGRVELPRGLHTLRLGVADGGWKLREFALL